MEEVLKLATDKLPNTTTVTKGGKTGNLFAQSVCWEQMTRKIKSANKVETSTKGCYFALCVFFLSFSLFHKAPYFLENTVRGSWFSFVEKANTVGAEQFPTLYATTDASVLSFVHDVRLC